MGMQGSHGARYNIHDSTGVQAGIVMISTGFGFEFHSSIGLDRNTHILKARALRVQYIQFSLICTIEKDTLSWTLKLMCKSH
jgi:hypothetical protein